MVATITRWVLRISGLLALILGILFWTGSVPDALISVHIILGILVTLSLWVLGFLFGRSRGGNWGLAALAIVWGLLVIGVGGSQIGQNPGTAVKIIHLLIGLLALGIGEMVAGRYKRLNVAPTQTM
ncbi:MAG: hypothetical protein NVSMB38_42800 [Ktedonobacteraceae bacterium]